jgi:hypothetical protein
MSALVSDASNENHPSAEAYTQGTLTEGGRLSTVYLLVLTSLDQLISILQTFFNLFTKQTPLMRRSTVLSLSLQLVFPVTPLEPLTIIACPNVKICTTLHGLMQQQAVTENLDYASLMNL